MCVCVIVVAPGVRGREEREVGGGAQLWPRAHVCVFQGGARVLFFFVHGGVPERNSSKKKKKQKVVIQTPLG